MGYREIEYDDEHWRLLRRFRVRATTLMKSLTRHGLRPIVYGSIARGDIQESSDIDIFIPQSISSAMLEVYLGEEGMEPVERILIQATPSYVPKAYLFVEESTSISFPLSKMRKEELDFYKLAGELDYEGLREDLRVPGMNKQLMLIIPTETGHMELPVEKNIETASKILGVDPSTLRNRVRVLKKRREFGRTGIYRRIEIPPEKTFEEVMHELLARDPALRRRLRTVR